MKLSKLFLVALAVVLVPAAAFAQTQITGEVTDNTGGVLPGVTVEASSPLLIEGSRVAVTDGPGRYTIIGLTAGTYTVTMTLPGFSTFVAEGVEVRPMICRSMGAQPFYVKNYGELILKGKSKQEILISTYVCHPSMANNELSGPIVSMNLINFFSKKKWTKQFVFYLYLKQLDQLFLSTKI